MLQFSDILYKAPPSGCEGCLPFSFDSPDHPYLPQAVVTAHFERWAAANMLAALLMTGCAHTSTVTAWTPAEIDVSGIGQVSVVGLNGEQSGSTAQMLNASLSKSDFYTVIDRNELLPIRWTSATSDDHSLLSLDDLQAAREADVDALLVGEVIESTCHDGSLEDSSSGKVHRQAKVAITFRLIGVENGDVRLSKETVHSLDEIVFINRPDTLSHDDVINQLTQQCVEEFVNSLAPHQREEPVTLARPALFQRGSSLVWNGNEFATRGRWDEATVAWERAISCNSSNDAALYNLAIAHAHQQSYDQAEQLAIRAVNLRHCPLYEAGLQRIRKQRDDFDITLQQRREVETASRQDSFVVRP